MTSQHTIEPTASELDILQFIWKNGPSTVRSVHDFLIESQKKDIRYTTTLKTMQVMLDRGLLKREIIEKKHIYDAAIKEETTKKKLLDRFLNYTFGGSAMQLVMQILGNYQTSQEELEKLKSYIDSIQEDQK